MKTCLIFAIVSLLTVTKGITQDASVHLVTEENIPDRLFIPDRLALIESTVALAAAQENIFWPLYEKYEKKRIEDEARSFRLLNGIKNEPLSKLNDGQSSFAQEILNVELSGIELRKEYFEKIESALNGNVALQFLQSEVMLDLVQRLEIYEKTDWSRPEWNAGMLKDENVRSQVMEFTLGLSGNDALTFRSLFEDYQFDYSRIVGHQYFFFEQYIDDVSLLTPAQSKKLGKEFLTMQQGEVVVRKNYFEKMLQFFGVRVATRFLAVDEYYSLMDKLKTWSDTSVLASR